MSKLVYVCLRNAENILQIKSKLEHISAQILPDNITPVPPKIADFDGIVFGIYNPHTSIRIKDASICAGNIYEEASWDQIDQAPPDGTYVIFRENKDYIQILSDVVATRTIWYYLDDEKFIAATSQRAIISLLGSFEFNEQVIPWMLTTGSLGPDQCWDRRVKRLGGDSTLTLNRAAWALSEKSQGIKFKSHPASNQEYENMLRNALADSFEHINLDYSQWALLLSGGIDSRGILSLLKDKTGLKSITWGMQSALAEKSSDAGIAKEIAQYYRISNEYFETDLSAESAETIFNRYLICGEGQIDHVAGYMDGFNIWKKLYDNGIRGIIRGDEGFGWVPVASPLDVRLSTGIPLWNDFSNLRDAREFGFSPQVLPDTLLQSPDESLESWRDRLYHQFRIPVVLGGLSDLKFPYVEIVNPLLSRKIIYTVRQLPDHLRTEKILYKNIVKSISPKIEFASQQAVAEKQSVLKQNKVVEFLRSELKSSYANAALPKEFTEYVVSQTIIKDEVVRRTQKGNLKNFIKPLLPKWVKGQIKSTIARPKIDFNTLAFRSFIVCRMHKLMNESVTH